MQCVCHAYVCHVCVHVLCARVLWVCSVLCVVCLGCGVTQWIRFAAIQSGLSQVSFRSHSGLQSGHIQVMQKLLVL